MNKCDLLKLANLNDRLQFSSIQRRSYLIKTQTINIQKYINKSIQKSFQVTKVYKKVLSPCWTYSFDPKSNSNRVVFHNFDNCYLIFIDLLFLNFQLKATINNMIYIFLHYVTTISTVSFKHFNCISIIYFLYITLIFYIDCSKCSYIVEVLHKNSFQHDTKWI